ncbi:MAG: hypothetical protein U7127_27805 [Phormidium sp.]
MPFQKRVNCFIEVLKTLPDLFTATDWIELAEIVNQLSEDSAEIWRAISPWLESHPEIKAAYKTKLETTSTPAASLDGHLGFGNSKPEETSNKPTSDPALLEKLKNEIHLHKPLNPPKQ